MTDRNVEVCSIFIQGKWVAAETERTEAVFNPSDGNIIARTPMCGSREVDMAVPPRLPCRIGPRHRSWNERG